METIFYRLDGKIKPTPGARILKSQDYATVLKAQQLLDDAQQEADRIKQEALSAYEEQKKQGYEDGVLEGQMQQAEKMLETGLQAVEYLENLEKKVVEVVTTAVRKIIGEMDDKERIVCIVKTALEQVQLRQQILIRVCPEEESIVRDNLKSMIRGAHHAHGLEIIADPRLKKGDCMLESEMGVIDASLETQLRAIEKAFAAKFEGSE